MAPKPKKASTSYSPAPMGAAAKKKTASRGEFVSAYSKAKQTPAKKSAKAGSSTVAAVAKRFGVTAREARDIATAVTTLGKAVVTPGSRYGSTAKNKSATIIKTTGDIAKQVGETYTAAKKGKSGTSAIQLKTMSRGASGLPSDVEYKTGSKRKPGSKK